LISFAAIINEHNWIMAGKTRPMSQIKQLLQLHKQGMKLNTIARTLGISRNTVKSYLLFIIIEKYTTY